MNSPNQNIPAAQQNPPIIVCRGTTPDQLQQDLLQAFMAGYLPEPGLMCTRNNEVWVICYLRNDDELNAVPQVQEPEPEPAPAPPPPVNPNLPAAPGQPQQPGAGGNVNESLARGRS